MAVSELAFTVTVDTEGIMERIHALLLDCLGEVEEKAQFWIQSGEAPEAAYRNAMAMARATVEQARAKLGADDADPTAPQALRG